MSDAAWYRSLYWRIALGIIVLLGVVLSAEAVLFVWVLSRARAAQPPAAAQYAARATALELEAQLEQDPATDLERFVRDRADTLSRSLVLVWEDGRVFASDGPPPPRVVEAALVRLRRRPEAGPGGLRPRVFGFAPVHVAGRPAGAVVVLPGPGPVALLRRLGPTLLLVALALALAGTALAAALVFGPAHRRLRTLERAARRLGAGDMAVRVPDTGGDEIASVARAFNAMAEEIAARTRALETSDRARRQLLADVSHELMTPLTAIRGYLETLRMPGLDLPPAARERYLGIVHEETLRVERLIGDLLDLSRLEAGGVSLSIVKVPVADLFARVQARHGRAIEEKRLTLDIAVAPDAAEVAADAARLEQALQNLAANAVRHTPPGGRIRLVSARAPDGRISLAVHDTGEGIPPEHLPHVFDRFYKANTSRPAQDAGSGLGLSIVKAIVERHGGEVRARSTPGVETVFEILLPAPAAPPQGA
jgi:signal transduction histidine kinase